MRKELRTATALVALLAWPALAQDTTPAAPAGPQTAPLSAPEAGNPPMPASPDAQPAAPSTAAASPPATGGPDFISTQADEETLASTLIGTQVTNGADESLGEVNDVLLAADGRLKAVVVGVGGFLGIAERDVAVPWEALGVNRDDEDQDLMLRLDVSREQLENAPEFEVGRRAQVGARSGPGGANPPAAGPGIGAGGAVAPAPVPGSTPAAPAQ